MSASQSTDAIIASAMRPPSAAGSFAARMRETASGMQIPGRCAYQRYMTTARAITERNASTHMRGPPYAHACPNVIAFISPLPF